MNAGERILIVCAHPDDEVLGCGGTIARFSREGNTIEGLILGEGVKARGGSNTEVEGLRLQAETSAELLGLKLEFKDLPDNQFDTVPLLEIVRLIECKIKDYKPSCIFTHHPRDLNIDHQLTASAVLTAARPLPDGVIKTIYAFEVPSSTEWNFGAAQQFNPDTFVDIGQTLEIKLAAFECYRTEMRPWPHSRSSEAVEALVKWRGATVGVDAAEAFQTLRRIL